MNYNWTCPECGEHVIEEVMSGVIQTSTVENFHLNEYNQISAEYAEVSCDGGDVGTIYYQCQECGYELSIDELQEVAKQSKKEEE